MLNRRLRGPLCWVMAFFTASYQHLLWTSTHQGPKAPSAWCGFPYHISSITPSPTLTGTVWLLSWLSYIIVQRPLSRLLDFWNRMLDHHQAEITVMQFTGHSLPVHQSMSVPWEFFTSSHFISQFPPTRFPLITAIRMCHLLRCITLEWRFGPGRRPKYNKRFYWFQWNPGQFWNCRYQNFNWASFLKSSSMNFLIIRMVFAHQCKIWYTFDTNKIGHTVLKLIQ